MSQHEAPQSAPKDKKTQPESPESFDITPATTDSYALHHIITDPTEANLTPKVVRALQRSHGNRFVNRLVQRAKVHYPLVQRGITPVAATYHNAAQLRRMTAGDFIQYTEEQVDWFTSPQLSDAEKQTYRTLHEFLRRPGVLAGCRDMTNNNLLRAGLINGATLNATIAEPLENYGRAVAQVEETIQIHPTDNVDIAKRWGEAVKEMANQIGGSLIKRSIPHAQFVALVNRRFMNDFIDYFNQCSPNLEDPSGGDVDSYIALRNEGKNPVSYLSTSLNGRIKDFHRFERRALDKLVQNFDLSGQPDASRKPLTLIIHSSSDHNAAFHRDTELTNVIRNPRLTVLLVEVTASLGAVESQIPTLARDYGKNGKLDQVMFAGHGNSRGIEMMPAQPGGGSQDLDLDTNAAATQSLMDTVVRNMATDPAVAPHRRIVFNACLTASNVVNLPDDAQGNPTHLSSNATTAQGQVRQRITSSPSLATFLRNRIGSSTIRVVGANGSITVVRLVDAGDGLDIITSDDPTVTSDDKLDYVERGTEPEGVLRAVLECWSGFGATDAAAQAQRRQDCFTKMQTRVSGGATTVWREVIIRTMYSRILASYRDNGEMIRNFAPAAYALAELVHEAECKPGALVNTGLMVGGAIATEATNLFSAIEGKPAWTSNDFIPLVVYQVWMHHDTAKETNFLAALDRFDGQTVSPPSGGFLHPVTLTDARLTSLLAVGSTPTRGRLLLACKIIANIRDHAIAKPYLMGVIGTGRRFPPALNINDILQGRPDESVVLRNLNLTAASTTQNANFDLDRDGTNETFIEPMAERTGINPATPAVVYERPDTTSRQLTTFQRDTTVRFAGKIQTFYAIYHDAAPSSIAFVLQSSFLTFT